MSEQGGRKESLGRWRKTAASLADVGGGLVMAPLYEATLQLSSNFYRACSAWWEIRTCSRFVGNAKLSSAQSKGASVR